MILPGAPAAMRFRILHPLDLCIGERPIEDAHLVDGPAKGIVGRAVAVLADPDIAAEPIVDGSGRRLVRHQRPKVFTLPSGLTRNTTLSPMETTSAPLTPVWVTFT